MTPINKLRLAFVLTLLVILASLEVAAQFSALCGTGASCAYQLGDEWGYQTANTVRLNFNNLDSRVTTLEGGSAAAVATFTNKTINAESTGNVITNPFKEYWEVGVCQNVTASTAWNLPTTNPAVAACSPGTNTQIGTLDFADGANALSAQRAMQLPADWTGTVDVNLYWFTTATTNSVVWQIATACVAAGESGDPAFNTANTVTDAAQGTASRYNTAAITTLTVTGCAAGEFMFVKVTRDPAHASDTLAATARLVGVELTLRRAM